MIQWLSQYSPVMQAFIATMFTWGVTALGASLVFFFKKVNQNVLNAMLGFAAGGMMYVVVEELIPEGQKKGYGINADITTIGFMLGFAVMMILDVALG